MESRKKVFALLLLVCITAPPVLWGAQMSAENIPSSLKKFKILKTEKPAIVIHGFNSKPVPLNILNKNFIYNTITESAFSFKGYFSTWESFIPVFSSNVNHLVVTINAP